jgi:hypothetical protein
MIEFRILQFKKSLFIKLNQIKNFFFKLQFLPKYYCIKSDFGCCQYFFDVNVNFDKINLIHELGILNPEL